MERVTEFIKKNLSDIIFLIGVGLLAYTVTNNIAILSIKGNSMFPTYSDGDILLIKKEHQIEMDDIVIFSSPDSWDDGDKSFIKRVIAKEGDNVEFKDSHVTVNGQNPIFIDRPFCELDDIHVQLEENQYFVLGDNIQNSNDSLTQLCFDNEYFYIVEEDFLAFGHQLFLFSGN